MHVYKLLRAAEWQVLEATGYFAGSPDDIRDGFIHLSAGNQVDETRRRHFAGASVVMITLEAEALGDALSWEPSRGGARFPHLYRPLTRADVVAVATLD